MLTRKKFLKNFGSGIAIISVVGTISLRRARLPVSVRKPYRLAPVEGYAYTASFRAFMHRARFATPREALKSVRNQQIPFKIETVEAKV